MRVAKNGPQLGAEGGGDPLANEAEGGGDPLAIEAFERHRT